MSIAATRRCPGAMVRRDESSGSMVVVSGKMGSGQGRGAMRMTIYNRAAPRLEHVANEPAGPGQSPAAPMPLDIRHVDHLHITIRTPTYAMTRSDPHLRAEKNELLKGTLDMLVLQTLSLRPMHGYGIAQQIGALSQDALRVEQGSLYPALERLQKRGWITSKWGESPTGRRARYYSITASGRRQLGNEISSFDAMLVAINRVLRRA